MEDNSTQPATQQVLDPRRLGITTSSLSPRDISNIMVILHPCSPAAYRVVMTTAQHSPQHVHPNQGLVTFADSGDEEQDTFIVKKELLSDVEDIALRFSSIPIAPGSGFCFGRNPRTCDIVLDNDSTKRISNLHFRIYVTNTGVVMLTDVSTNGTVVDEKLLKGKVNGAEVPLRLSTRMLNHGSIIQIPSPQPEESIKFIVRIPSREGYFSDYERNFERFVLRMEHDRAQNPNKQAGQPVGPPLITMRPRAMLPGNPYGMHWDGGDEYNIVGQLGKGAFATVYRLATKMDGQFYAAKELEKRRFMKNGRLDLKLHNEMEIMKSIRHNNIVNFVSYREFKDHLYIIMEYVPCGDLQGYLQRHGVLPEPDAKLMSRQIFDALAYLHSKKITHRDIKPDNILIACDDPFVVKLSDFGLSKVVSNNETFLKTFCGTLLYCAPEVFPHYEDHLKKGTKRRRSGSNGHPGFHSYSQSVDIWSYAAVLWYALCGKPPFEGVSDHTGRGMFEKIMGTNLSIEPLRAQGVSMTAVALLATMLNTDPSKRPGPRQCLEHDWLATLESRPSVATGLGLSAIPEGNEDEVHRGTDALSQLSIREEPGDEYGDFEWDSQDLDLLVAPRMSKRFKQEHYLAPDQIRDPEPIPSSSPDSASHDEANEMINMHKTPRPAQPARLFGEIGVSALQSSGVLGAHTNVALRMSSQMPENNHLAAKAKGHDDFDNGNFSALERRLTKFVNGQEDSQGGAASSLLGAESLVREMNMESPLSAPSPDEVALEQPGPHTPQLISQAPGAQNAGSDQLSLDATPKPKPNPFGRCIQAPSGSSFFNRLIEPPTDGLEEETGTMGNYLSQHVPETNRPVTEASEDDLHDPPTEEDNMDNPITPRNRTTIANGIPNTASHSWRSENSNRVLLAEQSIPPALNADALVPIYGRLMSTPDSFVNITINITSRVTTWGRARNNTVVYPDAMDVRISKIAVAIFLHAPNIEAYEASGGDWTKMPGLTSFVKTKATNGIFINGIRLKDVGPDGEDLCGRIYTGDEITAYSSTSNPNCVLRFRSMDDSLSTRGVMATVRCINTLCPVSTFGSRDLTKGPDVIITNIGEECRGRHHHRQERALYTGVTSAVQQEGVWCAKLEGRILDVQYKGQMDRALWDLRYLLSRFGRGGSALLIPSSCGADSVENCQSAEYLLS
ncbi:Pkinase-domain-containing protein [Trichodelitschia bisporula]|uniref:Pkinase-domain-containing protein n=1 Tax=Trichodelitschia bisporula TaxID=703511 RepID=A0A6G1HXA9_9PEZI|nr:Pkinase-domain-containing protein [Trichodelitschia bisporula]